MSGPVEPPAAAGVKSPCISVCEMDPGTGWCRGCSRTLDEIAGWVVFTDDEKRAVLARLGARRAVARPLQTQGGPAT